MNLDLELAADFLVLARNPSYTQAAARLTMTPSALSKRISRLERQVGVALVERAVVGPVLLTRAGVRFAETAGPLLRQAEWAKQQAVAATTPLVRIGYPSGAPVLLQRMGIRQIAAQARAVIPHLRLEVRDVPFTELDDCLPQGRVDVLITSAAVSRATVESIPLPFEAGRALIMEKTHSLADAGRLRTDDVMDTCMLHNPHAPGDWMRPFWFGDLRRSRDAHLVETAAVDHFAVMKDLAGTGEVVMGSVDIGMATLGSDFRVVRITDAPPIVIHAAKRDDDRREGVEVILSALRNAAPRRLT